MKLASILNHSKRILKYKYELAIPNQTPESLVVRHFSFWSELDHVNFKLFKILSTELSGKPAFILETGTSAWGTDSTRFWNTYVSKFGGKVISVDLRNNAGIQLRHQLSKKTTLVTSDSVKYLKENPFTDVDLYYFDSADVDWSEPKFAIRHGLEETNAVLNLLKPGTIVVFDDTPKNENYVEEHLKEIVRVHYENEGFYPGKGPLAIRALQEVYEIEVLHHEYSFACRILSKI